MAASRGNGMAARPPPMSAPRSTARLFNIEPVDLCVIAGPLLARLLRGREEFLSATASLHRVIYGLRRARPRWWCVKVRTRHADAGAIGPAFPDRAAGF